MAIFEPPLLVSFPFNWNVVERVCGADNLATILEHIDRHLHASLSLVSSNMSLKCIDFVVSSHFKSKCYSSAPVQFDLNKICSFFLVNGLLMTINEHSKCQLRMFCYAATLILN